jgi:predicted GIY-YIG superfamily endonuclease
MATRSSRKSRDTVNYVLYGPYGNPVYYGITNNLERRLREHERDGKVFYDVSVSSKRSRSRADKEETQAIHSHQQRNLIGAAPRYNKAKVKNNKPSYGLSFDLRKGLF